MLSFASDVPRILVLPFEIQSGNGDMSFLQEGATQMLTSRLASDGAMDVVSQNAAAQAAAGLSKPVGDTAAISVAAKSKAEYVSIGAIIITDQSVTTSARLIRVSDGTSLAVFNQTGKQQGDVIQQINAYAGAIHKALGITSAEESPAPVQPQTAEKSSAEAENHRDPNTLWTGPITAGPEPIKTMASDGRTAATIWKSLRFDSEIKSLSIGDILGDKKNELVIVNDNSVSLYRLESGKLQLISEATGGRDETPIRVDVADLNHNGRSEIFVTSLYRNKMELKSYVLEWNGTELVRIAQNLPWYFRAVTFPKTGLTLLGQQRGNAALFGGNVYEMTWQNGVYQPTSPVASPPGASIFGFTPGNAMNDGADMTVALTSALHLRLYSPSGDVEWTSSEQFTGSGVYMPYPQDDTESTGRNADPRIKRYYLPQRIFITDIDHDGKNEVLLLNDKDALRNYLPSLRLFKNGHIECLQWDPSGGFALKWKTTEMSGQISDMAIGDLYNDGQTQIVFSVIEVSGSAFNNARSHIISWETEK